ncbi:alpha/beta fold hydrolase [Desulfosporosinus sp. FKB]|uniref:alpha/beta fold hydrolase n=1 Tax=Desulfosporosinus sp. FKB TaxID=1969835 RepID=UPI000B49D476|nr:alpha/beta fold hydrolase [Desulfosporosinus sp. FKB]
MAKISSIYVNPENREKILSIYDKHLSQWPVPYESLDVPTRYGSTHFIVSGPKDAPPIVLMHGRGGTATMWLPNVFALSRDYRVYAIDTIGDFGKSELDDIDNYPKNGQACSDWLVDVFNELGLNQAFVIGESMGGWITMNLSIYAPERVKGIALLAPVGISSAVLGMVFRILLVSFHPTESNRKKFFRSYVGNSPLVSDTMVELMTANWDCRTKSAWPSKFSNDKLKQIKVPTLLFIGGKDPTFNKQRDIDRAVKMIPNIQLEVMTEIGHAMSIENADFVNNRILDFLKGIEWARGKFQVMKSNQSAGTNLERNVKFSIIIPAYNEEKFIGRCLDSIVAASPPYPDQVEVIVVLNRCTDRSEEIARSYNCVIVKEDRKNMSIIRNAGAKVSRGEIIATIDADSRMTDNMLTEIEEKLLTGMYIGGGVKMKFERLPLGVLLQGLILIPSIIKYKGVTAGILWCYKKDFDAINGFNENQRMLEDVDFGLRLKNWGRKCGKKYGTITKAQMIVSLRKADKCGNWILFKHPKWLLAYLKGNVEKYADESFYDFDKR